MSGAAGLVIQASARPDGATGRAVARLLAMLDRPRELIDLGARTLARFDYDRPSQEDDFDAIAGRMLAHPAILFATPVYWYAMSGLLKTLFDRFSDLLSDRDPEGRARRLAGRDMWMLAVGTDPELPDGFETPFRETAAYLEMNWRGGLYLAGDAAGEAGTRLRRFAARLDGRT